MLQVTILVERLKLFLMLYVLKCKNHSQFRLNQRQWAGGWRQGRVVVSDLVTEVC